MPVDVDPSVGIAALAAPTKRPVEESPSPLPGTPSRISTPPPQTARVHLEARLNVESGSSRVSRRGSSMARNDLDPDAVDNALRRELNRQQREGTPTASPHRKRQRITGDR